MDQHVRDDLSAYLDGALAPAERAVVDAHLAECALCLGAAADLRATARLIAALPLPAPSRRLVPSLAPRFAWLRPMRSLSAVLSGVFILVFMASATLDTGWRMGGGRAGSGGAATTAAQPARDAAAPASTGRLAPAVAPSPKAVAQEAARSSEPLRIGPSPWLWLGLALLSGMLAFAAHRRLRTP